MKKSIKKVAACLLCAAAVASAALMPAQAAVTIRDDELDHIATLKPVNSLGIAEGMAVGDTYLYAALINGSDSQCSIVRVHKDTGESTVMRNGANRRNYFGNLTHANDLEIMTEDGKEILYVLSSGNILVFEVDDRTLNPIGELFIMLGGKKFTPASIAIERVGEEETSFLFKSGLYIYRGTFPTGMHSGNIELSRVHYLDVTNIEIDGMLCDFTSFMNQAMFCQNNILYIVKAGCDKVETIRESIILGYELVPGKERLRPEPDLVFYFNSETYPALFEAEDCGISSDGKMYFNTNGRKSATETNHDGIFRIRNVDFSGERKAPDTFSVRYTANGGMGSMQWRTLLMGESIIHLENRITCKGHYFGGWVATRESDGTTLCVSRSNPEDKKWLKADAMGEEYVPYISFTGERMENLTDVVGDTILFSARWIAPGDVTEDGKLSFTDVMALRMYTKGFYPVPRAGKKLMDLNDDGWINDTDVHLLFAYVAGAIEEFPH